MPGVFVTPGRSAAPLVGVLRPVVIPAPAPGVEIVVPMPGGAWYRLVMGRFAFTASAVVANRNIRVNLSDGTDSYGEMISPLTVAAAGAVTYTVAPGIPSVSNTNAPSVASIYWPDILIPPGFRMGTPTAALDAGDQFGISRWLFEEVDLGPYGGPYGFVSLDDVPARGEGG